MKFLGIDYGTKNVGIAMSDDDGNMAFPRGTLLNTSALLEDVLKIIHNERIGSVVIGESKDFFGDDNPVMKKIETFKASLEEHGIPVYFEAETLSSQEASRPPERTNPQIAGSERLPKNDASAATIILQSYLDKQHG